MSAEGFPFEDIVGDDRDCAKHSGRTVQKRDDTRCVAFCTATRRRCCKPRKGKSVFCEVHFESCRGVTAHHNYDFTEATDAGDVPRVKRLALRLLYVLRGALLRSYNFGSDNFYRSVWSFPAQASPEAVQIAGELTSEFATRTLEICCGGGAASFDAWLKKELAMAWNENALVSRAGMREALMDLSEQASDGEKSGKTSFDSVREIRERLFELFKLNDMYERFPENMSMGELERARFETRDFTDEQKKIAKYDMLYPLAPNPVDLEGMEASDLVAALVLVMAYSAFTSGVRVVLAFACFCGWPDYGATHAVPFVLDDAIFRALQGLFSTSLGVKHLSVDSWRLFAQAVENGEKPAEALARVPEVTDRAKEFAALDRSLRNDLSTPCFGVRVDPAPGISSRVKFPPTKGSARRTGGSVKLDVGKIQGTLEGVLGKIPARRVDIDNRLDFPSLRRVSAGPAFNGVIGSTSTPAEAAPPPRTEAAPPPRTEAAPPPRAEADRPTQPANLQSKTGRRQK